MVRSSSSVGPAVVRRPRGLRNSFQHYQPQPPSPHRAHLVPPAAARAGPVAGHGPRLRAAAGNSGAPRPRGWRRPRQRIETRRSRPPGHLVVDAAARQGRSCLLPIPCAAAQPPRPAHFRRHRPATRPPGRLTYPLGGHGRTQIRPRWKLLACTSRRHRAQRPGGGFPAALQQATARSGSGAWGLDPFPSPGNGQPGPELAACRATGKTPDRCRSAAALAGIGNWHRGSSSQQGTPGRGTGLPRVRFIEHSLR